jgi:hypothetical protein
MTVYLLLIGLLLLLALVYPFAARKKPKLTRLLVVIIGVGALYAICALKASSVGRDSPEYLKGYEEISQLPASQLTYGNFEVGFVILCKTFLAFHAPFQVFVAVQYLVVCLPIAFVFYRRSPNPPVSLLLFVFWSILVFDLSGLRQAMAISMILLAYEFLIEAQEVALKKKKILFFILCGICVVLAASVHVSSLVFVMLFALSFAKFKGKYLAIAVPLLVLLFFLSGYIFTSIYYLSGSSNYLPGSYGGGGLFILYLVIMLFMVVFGNYSSFAAQIDAKMLGLDLKCARFANCLPNEVIPHNEKFYNGSLWAMLLAVFFEAFSRTNAVFPRFTWYFLIIVVIAIPAAIERQKSKMWRLCAYLVLLVFFGVYFYVNFLMKNALDILPYLFFWQA